MNGTLWRIHITCPRCGGEVEPVTESAANPSLCVETATLVRCRPCHDAFVIRVQMKSERSARKREAAAREAMERL